MYSLFLLIFMRLFSHAFFFFIWLPADPCRMTDSPWLTTLGVETMDDSEGNILSIPFPAVCALGPPPLPPFLSTASEQ